MSTPIPFLYKGENRLFAFPLLQEDGLTALLVSSLTYARVDLYQGSTLVVSYLMGTDAELRAATETDELLLELTSTLSNSLTANLPLTALLTLKVSDTDFESEPDLFIDKAKHVLVTEILAA